MNHKNGEQKPRVEPGSYRLPAQRLKLPLHRAGNEIERIWAFSGAYVPPLSVLNCFVEDVLGFVTGHLVLLLTVSSILPKRLNNQNKYATD